MTRWRGVVLASVSFLALCALGCRGVYSWSPGVYYGGEEPGFAVVPDAPPPLIIETRPARPDRLHIWIDGHWGWRGGRYEWEHGRWTVPPHSGSVWVAPRFERHDQGNRFTPGHWREERREERRDDRRDDRRDRRE